MARVVYQLMKHTDGKLVTFAGGTKDNAIPRECEASLVYADPEEARKAEEMAENLAGIWQMRLPRMKKDLYAR